MDLLSHTYATGLNTTFKSEFDLIKYNKIIILDNCYAASIFQALASSRSVMRQFSNIDDNKA